MPTMPFLFAFLNHPAMLGWLVAASAPLLIHLLNKRKFREVPWAAMHYLLAALRKNSRRLQIEQWILLALRTLLVMLVVAAVAEPFLEQAGLKLVSGQRAHKVLVLDGSFSMAYRPTDKSLFDRAKELASRIVDESNQGDGFTLVLMADPPRVIVGTPAFEPKDFMQEIDSLALPHGSGDLPATLGKVEEVLQAARREHANLKREEVIFLTDLGRTSWSPELGSSHGQAEFRERSERLGNACALVVIDLGQSAAENMAISQLKISEPFATLSRESTIQAELSNFGRQARTRQLVELFVDGHRAGEDLVDLPPGGQASISFPYRFENAGDRAVEVRLASDLLDLDNHRWLSVAVKEHLRILCVNGKPASEGTSGATDFLAVALSPREDDDLRSPIRAEVVSESALAELDLEQYDCVFLANVAQFTAREARLLSAYLEQGGGLVFFLGDQVRADSYNRYLLPSEPGAKRVLPASLGANVSEQQYYFFDPLGYEHTLISAFRGQQEAGLLTTPVSRYFRLELPPDSLAKVALAFENGDPVIVEEKLGQGRSILVATSADTSWTAMPVLPSFVPIVQELAALAVRGQVDQRNVAVGQSLGGPVPPGASSSTVRIRKPDGTTDNVRPEASARGTSWAFLETFASGLYDVKFTQDAGRGNLYAINLDTLESNLEKLDAADLKDDIWPKVRFEHRTDWQNPSEEPTQEIVRHGTLHQEVLLVALAVMLVEGFLASWFGRRMA